MIRLNLAKTAQWIDLGHGVEVLCAPHTTAVFMAARASLVLLHIPETAESPASWRAAALLRAVGRAVITEWRGVVQHDGTPAPVTPDGIDALLDLYPMALAFEQAYMQPAMLLASEKKDLAPLPDGTSAGAPDIAAPAASAVPSALTS